MFREPRMVFISAFCQYLHSGKCRHCTRVSAPVRVKTATESPTRLVQCFRDFMTRISLNAGPFMTHEIAIPLH